jgi:hypothetical protein
LTHNPAQIDIRGKIGTKSNWRYLGGICGGHSLKDTPRNALQDLTHEQSWKVLGEERDEDEANHGE